MAERDDGCVGGMLAARDADNVAVARFHSAAVIAAEDDGHAIAFADGFDGRDDGASVGIDKDFAQLAETAMPRRCRCDGSLHGESILCRLRRIFLLLLVRFQELLQPRLRDLPASFHRIVLRGLRSLDDEVEDVFITA